MNCSLEDDRRGIEEMKAQFDAISQLAENDFVGSLNFSMRANHYATVYNFATRGTVAQFDENYSRHEILYVDYQEMLTRFMTRFHADPRWSDAELFSRIVKWWRLYRVISRYCMKTFAYVSRFYVSHWSKMPLPQVAMSIFLEQLFRKHEGVVRSTILELVYKERRGEKTDRELVQSAIEMYAAMGIDNLNTIYTDHFLTPYIQAAADYYRKESVVWASTDSGTTYLRKAEQCLAEEKSRCLKYFTMEEDRRIMSSVEQALLDTDVARRVLFHPESGFASVVAKRDTSNLKRFHKIFAHLTSGRDLMAQSFKERLVAEGLEKTKQHSGSERDINCKSCVTDLVSLHEEFHSIVVHCFGSHAVMLKALRDGLERVYNSGIVATDAAGASVTVSFSELLANYLDLILRQPPADDSAVEASFDQVVGVMRYISDSDKFQQHARELLAKRLLSQTTKANEALERLLLTRLKQRCGAHFTTQFEGMMHDRTTSAELSAKFREYTADNPLSFELQCMVLKTGIWPKFPVEDGVLPPHDFVVAMERFNAFHAEDTRNRVLKWSHASSGVVLTARFAAGQKELQVTSFQSWVLLLYNTSEPPRLSVQQMLDALQMDMEELRRVLFSFSKIKMLVRESEANAPLTASDIFALNTEFSSSHRKMLIPLLVPRITVAATTKSSQQAEEDRKPTIDSALVRIMKSRRVMSHAELVAECTAALSSRFAVDVKLIKLRIEDLIRREYIERSADNGTIYRYIA